MLKENINNNNSLSDTRLTRVLVIADNLSREAIIRFNAGTPETATIGRIADRGEIFGRALGAGLDEGGIPYDPATLVLRAIATGLRANFEMASYDRQRRSTMILQLREILHPATAGAIRKPEPIIA